MKLLQKMKTVVWMVGIVSFSGSIVASTNLYCTIDCEPFQSAGNSDKHICCFKHGKSQQSQDMLTEKCPNCIESVGDSLIISADTGTKKHLEKPSAVLFMVLSVPAEIQSQSAIVKFSSGPVRTPVYEPCYIRLCKLVI
jgi:hypothetical protein